MAIAQDVGEISSPRSPEKGFLGKVWARLGRGKRVPYKGTGIAMSAIIDRAQQKSKERLKTDIGEQPNAGKKIADELSMEEDPRFTKILEQLQGAVDPEKLA